MVIIPNLRYAERRARVVLSIVMSLKAKKEAVRFRCLLGDFITDTAVKDRGALYSSCGSSSQL